MNKVVMLINTRGIEYDDRLIKESKTLKKKGSLVKIIALEKKNAITEGYYDEEIPFLTIKLKSRERFQQKRFLVVKIIEMYFHMYRKVKKEKSNNLTVWIHNIETIGLIPFLYLLKRKGDIKKIVWDQHELPSDSFLSNKIFMMLYKICSNMTDEIVMANSKRKEFILSQSKISTPINIISNYPLLNFKKSIKAEMTDNMFLKWWNKDPYLICQGGGYENRYFSNVLESAVKLEVKVVFIGDFDKKVKETIFNKYENASDLVYFTGLIKFTEIQMYLDNSFGSIILYKNNSFNNYYCDPNRLYMAINRGKVVLVGNNPPMKEIVKREKIGVVIDSDGGDLLEIIRGIKEIQKYKIATPKLTKEYVWETNELSFEKIIG